MGFYPIRVSVFPDWRSSKITGDYQNNTSEVGFCRSNDRFPTQEIYIRILAMIRGWVHKKSHEMSK